jgi:hypothetical protein
MGSKGSGNLINFLIFMLLLVLALWILTWRLPPIEASSDEQNGAVIEMQARYDELKAKIGILETDIQSITSSIQEASDRIEKLEIVPSEPPSGDAISEFSDESENYIVMALPDGISGKFKTYMDYRTITNRSSKQWQLQQSAVTDADGFRKLNGRYMVALGTYYSSSPGDFFDIELRGGQILPCVIGDIKDNRHTDPSNRYVERLGNIVEFIIDKNVMDRAVLRSGDVSNAGLEGGIASIKMVTG